MIRFSERICGLFIALCAISTRGIPIPPKEMPESLKNDYTLNGSIPIERFYVDDTLKGRGTHFKYSHSHLESLIKHMRSKLDTFRKSLHTNPDLYQSLPKHDWPLLAMLMIEEKIQDRDIIVFGTTDPWAEAASVALGCGSVTTVEYNSLSFDHPSMKTWTVQEFQQNPQQQWDVLMSFSSFDHDGLGRYGDPLNPSGDLDAMRLMLSCAKPSATALLTVPIGPDVIVWNLERRYGQIRLPMLLEGWTMASSIGYDEDLLTIKADYRRSYEPVFLLEPRTLEHDEL